MKPRLTEEQVQEIQWLYQLNIKPSEIARAYNVTRPAIQYYIRHLDKLPIGQVIDKHYHQEAA